MTIRFLAAALALFGALAAPLAPLLAQTADAVSAEERARFGHGDLRRGADGNNPQAENYANFDQALVGTLQPPPLFTTRSQATLASWPARRAEIAALIESEFVGRIPQAAADLRIVWTPQEVAAPAGTSAEHMIGQVLSPHGGMGPVIDGTLTLPTGARNVPVVIEYSYIWPPGFRFPGPPVPSLRDAALARGWGHFAYRPTLLQADDLGQLARGVIGQTRFPREEHDWGALRAWGWGASRLREQLGADPRVDASRISLAGHSRFGKAVLVAAAFDLDFADALVSSSGAGGAKLMRRDLGERLENMADPYASIWYAPRLRHYAGRASVAEWPVDAHMLIALRAPRPLFITSGLPERGDGWVDPVGMWTAFALAQPAWELSGATIPHGGMPVAQSLEQARYPLGWYQHGEGHVMWPAFAAFLDHADRFAGD